MQVVICTLWQLYFNIHTKCLWSIPIASCITCRCGVCVHCIDPYVCECVLTGNDFKNQSNKIFCVQRYATNNMFISIADWIAFEIHIWLKLSLQIGLHKIRRDSGSCRGKCNLVILMAIARNIVNTDRIRCTYMCVCVCVRIGMSQPCVAFIRMQCI